MAEEVPNDLPASWMTLSHTLLFTATFLIPQSWVYVQLRSVVSDLVRESHGPWRSGFWQGSTTGGPQADGQWLPGRQVRRHLVATHTTYTQPIGAGLYREIYRPTLDTLSKILHPSLQNRPRPTHRRTECFGRNILLAVMCDNLS